MASQKPFFQCFFRRLKGRGELLKFAYFPTFLNDFDHPREVIFDAFFETSFFKCFFALRLKIKLLNFERFSIFLRRSLIFEPPAKNIKNES